MNQGETRIKLSANNVKKILWDSNVDSDYYNHKGIRVGKRDNGQEEYDGKLEENRIIFWNTPLFWLSQKLR